MSTTAAVFDGKIAKWKQEMELPWAKLKYKLGQANLAKHLGGHPMRILDAGGGNGLDSLPFAKLGHRVDILDYSQEMLRDARQRAAQEEVQQQVATHLADVRTVDEMFPASHFDLILCHNLLQYMDDVPSLLARFSTLLKPEGILSVVSINRYSTPYHAAFLEDDLSAALAQLERRTSKAKIFDAEMTSYCAQEIRGLLETAGLTPEADYGIRCLCDYWGDNERKLDPAVFAQVERLEFALTELHPYKLLARYFQVVARKPNNAGGRETQ